MNRMIGVLCLACAISSPAWHGQWDRPLEFNNDRPEASRFRAGALSHGQYGASIYLTDSEVEKFDVNGKEETWYGGTVLMHVDRQNGPSLGIKKVLEYPGNVGPVSSGDLLLGFEMRGIVFEHKGQKAVITHEDLAKLKALATAAR